MAHPDDTPPGGLPAIPDETPTSPDLATFPCPYCQGDDGKPTGLVLDVTEWQGKHKARAATCGSLPDHPAGCRGTKRIDRQQMASYLATRQGRPR